MSKIRVAQGSFAIIPDDLGDVALSPEYPTFEIDTSLADPGYLELALRSQKALGQLRPSGNTTKQRVTPDKLLGVTIPCPGIDDQRTLVAAHRDAAARAAALEAEAAVLEADGLRAFEAALGVVPPPPVPDRPLFVARFSDLGRWSHEAVLRRVTGAEPTPSPHPVVALGEVVADLSVGYSPRCLTEPAENDGWGVLKLSAVTSGQFAPHANKAVRSPGDVRPGLQVKAGNVLIARGSGVTRFVGAACMVTEHRSRLLLSDLIFRVDFGTGNAIVPEFLTCVLGTPTVRRQIEETRTGAAPGIQKTTKGALLRVTFPMPTDLAVQAALAADLAAARAAAADRRDRAAITRRDAWRAFETAVYGDAVEPPLMEEQRDEVEDEV